VIQPTTNKEGGDYVLNKPNRKDSQESGKKTLTDSDEFDTPLFIPTKEEEVNQDATETNETETTTIQDYNPDQDR
jgi:hypothetical protein